MNRPLMHRAFSANEGGGGKGAKKKTREKWGAEKKRRVEKNGLTDNVVIEP